MEQIFEHSMILVIVNQGFSAEIMEVIREAGATGGTVAHAVGSELGNLEAFFGMTLKPEKELVLILTQQSLRERDHAGHNENARFRNRYGCAHVFLTDGSGHRAYFSRKS